MECRTSRTRRIWMAAVVTLGLCLAASAANAEEEGEAQDPPAGDVDARGVTVGANMMSVVHKDSDGRTFAFPGVCTTPTLGAPVPVPYPDIGPNATELPPGRHKIEGGGELVVTKASTSKSAGDDAGTVMGVVSSKVKGKAEFVNYSPKVQLQGAKVARTASPTASNVTVSRGVSPGESTIIRLEDGSICGVCMRNRRITAIYKLQQRR